MEQNLFEKYEVHPAIAAASQVDKSWVYSKARPVDASNPTDISLVRDLSVIMQCSLHEYGWYAVSSNNLCWNGTNEPIRVIMVPHPERDYLTIANPQIKEYGGKPIKTEEGCSSFPGALYIIKRKPFVRVTGQILGKSGFLPVELEYGSRTISIRDGKNAVGYFDLEKRLNLEQRLNNAVYVQHEIEHLDGIVIADKGVLSRGAGIDEWIKIMNALAMLDSF